MPDREKVIKRLEEISDYFFGVYHRSKDREEINKAKDRCDAVEDALALLKEQEAKKPIYNNEKYGDYLPHCSSCEKVLPNRSQYGDAKFCHICGQVIRWK
jgi:hypothetical protein